MPNKIDETTHLELLIAIHRYLRNGPCKEAAKVLGEEIDNLKLIPNRYDYLGNAHSRTLREYEQLLGSQSPLISLIERLSKLSDQDVPTTLNTNMPIRIFSSKCFSLTRTSDSLRNSRKFRNALFPNSITSINRLNRERTLQIRQLGIPVTTKQLLNKESVKSLDLHCCVLGHLSSVFCVAFDRSGEYVITGADDNLVKVWTVATASLRFTLRGHASEISDLSVSYDNSLLATGSNDKIVRIWCLQTAASLFLLKNHTAMVTSLTFLPFVEGNVRFLVSTGADCFVNFYQYDVNDRQFSRQPTYRFNERVSSGTRIISSCYSPGGTFFVVGDVHRFVRVFRVSASAVEKLSDVDAHSDRIDSLDWAHSGLRFASGSRDGLAKIWTFIQNKWAPLELRTQVKIDKASKMSYKVTTICWSLRDDFLITAGSDYIIRVWSTDKGEQVRELVGHKDSASLLTAHPVFEEYVISAGHDGFLMVWDIYTGCLLRRHQNRLDTCGNGAIFDVAVSQGGDLISMVDSHGRFIVLGIGTNQEAKVSPYEQFLSSDYMRVVVDDDNLLDEDTGIALHLLSPPNLVSSNGNTYDAETQFRLMPGIAATMGKEMNLPKHPWGNRPLVDRFDESIMKCRDELTSEIRQMEADALRREIKNTNRIALNDDEMLSNAISPARSRRPRTSQELSAQQEEAPRIVYLDDSINSLDSSFTEDESATDSSDSEYVDSTTRRAVARRSNRTEREVVVSASAASSSTNRIRSRRRRRIVAESDDGTSVHEENEASIDGISEDEELDDEVEEEEDDDDDDDDEDDDENEDDDDYYDDSSTRSSARRRRMGQRLDQSDATTSSSGIHSNRSRIQRHTSADRETPALIDFPSWMRLTQPLRFPYVAQIGDEVVYFRQGHEFYLKAVKKKSLYHVTHHLNPLAQLDAEEFCKVEEVKYVRKPYRLTIVKLAQLDEHGQRSGLTFYVKFHDMDDVPDFIILRHLYDESVARRYQPGMRIETILDDHWWTGTIDKREVHDEENYPRSNWYCLTVRWDTGEDEKMSPWDVQPQQPNRRSGIASDDDKVRFSQCPINDHDWIGAVNGIEGCSARLLDAIQTLGDESSVLPFLNPVNLDEYPDYLQDINYPIDLRTIEKRVHNRFYRRLTSLQQDIRYIAINARLFNQPSSEIVRNSRVLVEALVRYLRDGQYTNVMQLFMELKYGLDSELREYKSIDHCDDVRQSNGVNSHRPSETTSNASGSPKCEWLVECERKFDDLTKQTFSRCFIDKDDGYVTEAIHEGCHDLKTIKQKLNKCEFSNPLEVMDAVKNLMQAIRNVYDNKRSPIFRESLTFSAAFNDLMAPIIAKWQRMSQQQNESSNEGHCLRNRQKIVHVYNTRSGHGSKADDSKVEMRSRSGRLVKICSGYFHSLINGDVEQATLENDHSLTADREEKISKRNQKKGSPPDQKVTVRLAKNHKNQRINEICDNEKPGPSGMQHINGVTNSTKRQENKQFVSLKSETPSVSDENDSKTDLRARAQFPDVSDISAENSNDSIRSSLRRTERNRKPLKRFYHDFDSIPRKKARKPHSGRQMRGNHLSDSENGVRTRLRRGVQRNVNYNEDELADYSD